MIDPSEFGLPVRDPETYMILAVMDLIKVVGKKALHTHGELTNEYLGMISLYAIRRSYKFYGKGSPYGSLIKQAYDAFEPDHMSDRLKRLLTNLLQESSEKAAPEDPPNLVLSIRELHLPDSLVCRLSSAGIKSVTDLLMLNREQIRYLRSLGDDSADIIAEALENNGYKTKAMVLAFPGSTLKEIESARKDPNSVLSLPLSLHLGNRLYRNGIKTISQLKELSVDDLAELKDVSYEDILYALSSLNT